MSWGNLGPFLFSMLAGVGLNWQVFRADGYKMVTVFDRVLE